MEGGNLMDTIEVSGQPMTLEAFEQMALANNPAIVAANATSSVANGYRYQVGLRPNPTLGYFGSQIADAGTDQHGAFVEQEFVRGNKLALNRQVHSHTLHAQQFEAQVQQYRVLTDVRTRFYLAVAAQRELDVINEFLKVAERGVEVALDRQKAEEASEIEVLQSRTLLSEINLAREQVLASYRGAWNELAAVVGTPELSPMRLEPRFDLPQQSPAWEEAYQTIVAQSPELRVANELVCERRANLTRQQAQPIPNVTTQFGAGYDNGTGQGLINIQVGAPIPVFNKNSGNIAAAYADYTRALENVRRIELEIKSRLARSAQDFESAFAAVQKYQYEIIPQADETLQLSEQAYTAGELDFLQVLVVRRVYFNSTVQLIRAQAQLAQANARINGLLLEGGLNAPEDYTSDDGLRGQSLGGQ
jgi:cobalt-zinc-cadmium efflux system outer membrane protein